MVGSLHSVPVDHTEKLVTVIELKLLGDSAVKRWTNSMSSRTTSQPRDRARTAVSNVADLVLVPPGSIPTTTSSKIEGARLCETIPAAAIHPVGRLS